MRDLPDTGRRSQKGGHENVEIELSLPSKWFFINVLLTGASLASLVLSVYHQAALSAPCKPPSSLFYHLTPRNASSAYMFQYPHGSDLGHNRSALWVSAMDETSDGEADDATSRYDTLVSWFGTRNHISDVDIVQTEDLQIVRGRDSLSGIYARLVYLQGPGSVLHPESSVLFTRAYTYHATASWGEFQGASSVVVTPSHTGRQPRRVDVRYRC